MKCKVVALRSGGRVLRANELAEPMSGEVEVADFDGPKDGKPKRFLRAAYFRTDDHGQHTYTRLAMSPLFDPRIVKLQGGALILEGVQLACDGATGPLHEHVQVWKCQIY